MSFFDDEDHILYLNLLREYSANYGVRIWDYALMSNHIHAIVVPECEAALSNTFRDTHAVYAAEFNRKYDLSGHLWQARYYSCVLDEAHLWAAVRYVERNPVRAGIVSRAEEYRWSSAAARVHQVPDPMLDEGVPLISAVGNWSDWLAAQDVDSQNKAIREATASGRPLGSEEFVERLEAELGRALRPQRRGRRSATLDNSDTHQKGLF